MATPPAPREQQTTADQNADDDIFAKFEESPPPASNQVNLVFGTRVHKRACAHTQHTHTQMADKQEAIYISVRSTCCLQLSNYCVTICASSRA